MNGNKRSALTAGYKGDTEVNRSVYNMIRAVVAALTRRIFRDRGKGRRVSLAADPAANSVA